MSASCDLVHLTDSCTNYFFCSKGAPQHVIVPVPPLVTITCEPHLLQM